MKIQLVWIKFIFFLCLTFFITTSGYAQKNTPPPLTPLAHDHIHDPENSAITSLQNPEESMASFPKDRRGEVNWVKALADGNIAPFSNLPGKEDNLEILDLDVIMTNTKKMPNVRFSHYIHTQWLACSNCHPDIFIQKKDANPVKMEKILKGQFCGVCHGKVSFALWICERCHSVPHENSPPAWWK